jgi:hypothetical protein
VRKVASEGKFERRRIERNDKSHEKRKMKESRKGFNKKKTFLQLSNNFLLEEEIWESRKIPH